MRDDRKSSRLHSNKQKSNAFRVFERESVTKIYQLGHIQPGALTASALFILFRWIYSQVYSYQQEISFIISISSRRRRRRQLGVEQKAQIEKPTREREWIAVSVIQFLIDYPPSCYLCGRSEMKNHRTEPRSQKKIENK